MKSIKTIKNLKLRMLVFVVLMIITAGWFYLRITNGGQGISILEENQERAETAGVVSCGASENTTVVKIIDGDTIEVTGGYRVRLLAIDTPEYGESCYKEARDRIEKLLLGKSVALEKDQTDVDKYGRCLRYVFLDGENINVEMVGEGLAKSDIFDADIKYKSEIESAEFGAMLAKSGCLWAAGEGGR